jgi:hypothetical protein
MTKDEQARARLVEIALDVADGPIEYNPMRDPFAMRLRAGFRDPSKGHWCAAGLAAAMEDAGLVVPEPGTPARRGAIALFDFVVATAAPGGLVVGRAGYPDDLAPAQPGDIIAWLRHPPPDPAGWRRGHVAVIVAVDDESVTTVGWNEGPSPGRVMMRRLWREHVYFEPQEHPHSVHVKKHPRSSTVLWRRLGGLYGIARPVAR